MYMKIYSNTILFMSPWFSSNVLEFLFFMLLKCRFICKLFEPSFPALDIIHEHFRSGQQQVDNKTRSYYLLQLIFYFYCIFVFFKSLAYASVSNPMKSAISS